MRAALDRQVEDVKDMWAAGHIPVAHTDGYLGRIAALKVLVEMDYEGVMSAFEIEKAPEVPA